MEQINVQYYNLPCTIASFVRENEDLSYTVVLNSRQTREQNIEAYAHEVRHITGHDLESEDNVDIIEQDAHKED